MEQITFTTHNGTHLDAPWHYASTLDGGKPAMKIDEVPLEWFFLDGRKARLPPTSPTAMSAGRRRQARARPHRLHAKAARHRAGEHRRRDVLRRAELSRQRLRHGPRGDALSAPPGRARHRHRRLELGRAVLVHRTSASSRPATPASSGKATRPAARSAIATWKSSPTSTQLPPFGFKVACFPVKIEAASAGWTRCVAMLDN